MSNKFPPGWDEERVRRVLAHYEQQTEEEAVAEDEAAFEQKGQVFIAIPNELLPKVRELIARHESVSDRLEVGGDEGMTRYTASRPPRF